MFLSRFGVKRYKCLGDIDIPLTPIHVLIGPNDSGKTSLMEAMEAFFASSDRLLTQIFPQPWSGRELVLHGDDSGSIALSGGWSHPQKNANSHSDVEYGFGVAFSSTGVNARLTGEWLRVGNEGRSAIPPDVPWDRTCVYRWRNEASTPSPTLDTNHRSALASLLTTAHRYAFDATTMAVPAAIEPRRRFRMDPDGFGLATLLDDILGYDAELFINLRTQFCEFFPQFKSVRVESENESLHRAYPLPGGVNKAVGKGIRFETRSGTTVRAQQASDGAILFLGFLALAHLPEPPGLLLIEEPENGIYPRRLHEVIRMLRELVHRGDGRPFPQVILSTHSPYILSLFGPEEVTLLSRPPDKPDAPVRARPLREAPHIYERLGEGEFYLGELWYNLSEEELFGEPAGQRDS